MPVVSQPGPRQTDRTLLRSFHIPCNDIFNCTSLCEFYRGRLLLHLTIPFEEKPKSNLPGDNLRYYRLRKQLTTRQLVEQINIDPTTILQNGVCLWEDSGSIWCQEPTLLIRQNLAVVPFCTSYVIANFGIAQSVRFFRAFKARGQPAWSADWLPSAFMKWHLL